MIPEEQARQALRHVEVWSRYYCRLQGGVLDLGEYEDAGMAALLRCLQRYDVTRGVRFATYAEPRIRGACQDAPGPYARWRHGRPAGGHPRWVHEAAVLRPVASGEVIEERLALRQRVQGLPVWAQRYAQALLAGYTDAEFAAQEGRSVVWLWQHRKAFYSSLSSS